jgi:hypothetical protein
MRSAGSALLPAQSKDPNNEGLWPTQALIHEAVAAAAAAAAAAADADAAQPGALAGGLAEADGDASAHHHAATTPGGKRRAAGGNEQALAAFSLAADLAQSPAAVTPSALHALQLLLRGPPGATAAVGGGGGGFGGGAMPARAAATRTTLPLASPLEIASCAEVGAARDPTNPLAALLHVEAALVFAVAMTWRCLPAADEAEEEGAVAARPGEEPSSGLPAIVGDLLARTKAAAAAPSRAAAALPHAGTSDVEAARRLWHAVEGLAGEFVGQWGGDAGTTPGHGGARVRDAAIAEAQLAAAVARELQAWCGESA